MTLLPDGENLDPISNQASPVRSYERIHHSQHPGARSPDFVTTQEISLLRPIESVATSSSFPPPTPLESSRKRHRPHYSEEGPIHVPDYREQWLQSAPQRSRVDPYPGYNYGGQGHFAPQYDTFNTSAHHTGTSEQASMWHTYPPSFHGAAPWYDHRSMDSFMPPRSSQPAMHPQERNSWMPHQSIHPQQQAPRDYSHRVDWKGSNRPDSIVEPRQASGASAYGVGGNNSNLTEFDLYHGELLHPSDETQPQKSESSSSASAR